MELKASTTGDSGGSHAVGVLTRTRDRRLVYTFMVDVLARPCERFVMEGSLLTAGPRHVLCRTPPSQTPEGRCFLLL